ncbi:helix-turn-helix transcriptional regulator [Lactobacillus murinus]|uniref:Helix-turn-helix transcriptional regulator n=1 Tax=Ligilactobacillus murinus TaxID=1622 RepID=A0AAE7BRX1_9LACO|nr:helix-turn-helix transcriptional regulator [Ligilactobacillus murinus]NEG08792.1 helix-turn-helix transcriptional regulator [Ligilactobacillus murinus]NEG22380.1 helix-turn-helix transcriptional regulator [Ligilactobacillus murinus]NEG26991.1 helix-turn-helix transcriptional regulator [Ligilactobacillus murinus]QIA91044.1 helix-turn-helix transcriptional regulator [Ligilactobacillus murinus]
MRSVHKLKNRLKEARLEKGLTLKQASKHIGIRDSTLSQYETGKREPKLETWVKLADYFGVSVGYLQGIEDKYTGVMADSERQVRRNKIKENMAKTLRRAWAEDEPWEEVYADFKRQWNLLELEFQKITQDMER